MKTVVMHNPPGVIDTDNTNWGTASGSIINYLKIGDIAIEDCGDTYNKYVIIGFEDYTIVVKSVTRVKDLHYSTEKYDGIVRLSIVRCEELFKDTIDVKLRMLNV